GESASGEADAARAHQGQSVYYGESAGDDRRDVKVAAAATGGRESVIRPRAEGAGQRRTNDRHRDKKSHQKTGQEETAVKRGERFFSCAAGVEGVRGEQVAQQ